MPAAMPTSQPLYLRYLRNLVYGIARRFPIRPSDSVEATLLCQALREHGISSTLGKLSKAGDDPVHIVAEYQKASNALKSSTVTDNFYLSIKPPALEFNPQHAESIVATALGNGHSVHFDAHGFVYADQTLNLLETVMERTSLHSARSWTFGLTLPSRWQRSLADARWVAKRGVRPRLVKGDFKAPASEEVEPVQGLLALVDLLAGEVPELALASHDCALAREVVARCRARSTKVQLELFFGMPSSAMLALSRELGVPLRFYVPYGDTLLVYVIRDLITNPHKILRPSSLEVLGGQDRKLSRIIGFR